jgi:hypothetical protein
VHDANRSLDLTELLSRIHKQAVLVGGPHDGKRAPLPPIIYDTEHPKYLCQPGRSNDQTWYHYQLETNTTYVYVDHCNTLPGHSHNPDEIPDEQERSIPERWLFAASALVVLLASTIAVGFVIGYLWGVLFP